MLRSFYRALEPVEEKSCLQFKKPPTKLMSSDRFLTEEYKSVRFIN